MNTTQAIRAAGGVTYSDGLITFSDTAKFLAAAALVRPMAGEGAIGVTLQNAYDTLKQLLDTHWERWTKNEIDLAGATLRDLRAVFAATPQAGPTPQEIRRAENAAELTRVYEPQAVQQEGAKVDAGMLLVDTAIRQALSYDSLGLDKTRSKLRGLFAATPQAPRRYHDDEIPGADVPAQAVQQEVQPSPAGAVPHVGSKEAADAIERELAHRNYPSNSMNAARAGYEAARKFAAAPSAAALDARDGERKSLNAMAADLLRPYLKPGQKVIWREAFRWFDDNGVMPNHYDGMELKSLAEEFEYDWTHEFNFKHAAIITPKVSP
jgi:cell pole-organizing protein PopZ